MAMSNPEFSDPIQSAYDISTIPTAAAASSSSINSENHQLQQQGQEQEQKAEQDKAEEENKQDEAEQVEAACHRRTPSKAAAANPHETTPFSGELLEVVADDGFKTPTRPESRIPEIRTCPPPPRKNLERPSSPGAASSSSSRKRRKIWSTSALTDDGVLLDLSMEVESMFPPIIRANCGQKIKRSARSC